MAYTEICRSVTEPGMNPDAPAAQNSRPARARGGREPCCRCRAWVFRFRRWGRAGLRQSGIGLRQPRLPKRRTALAGRTAVGASLAVPGLRFQGADEVEGDLAPVRAVAML